MSRGWAGDTPQAPFPPSVTRWLLLSSPGQLKEVVKVLEKLNRSGRWKWLLHYKESKKLREDVR